MRVLYDTSSGKHRITIGLRIIYLFFFKQIKLYSMYTRKLGVTLCDKDLTILWFLIFR